MKMLFVTARFPYPPLKGDQVRAYHQLRLLSRRHAIHLVSLSNVPPLERDVKRIECYTQRLEVVLHGPLAQCHALMKGILSRDALQISLFKNARLCKAIMAWR